MELKKVTVRISLIAKAFAKIYKTIDKQQIAEIETELLKIYPSPESEVLLSADYDDEENSVGVSIYVSKPLPSDMVQKMNFDKLMFEYLLYADISKLHDVFECLQLMERKGSEAYEIDFIPVFYTKEIDSYDINFRILKNK